MTKNKPAVTGVGEKMLKTAMRVNRRRQTVDHSGCMSLPTTYAAGYICGKEFKGLFHHFIRYNNDQIVRLTSMSQMWSDPELKPLVSESSGLLERESRKELESRRFAMRAIPGNFSKKSAVMPTDSGGR